jgi:hypothetical protein
MTDQPEVSVKLDDRIRLMSALLAATDFPEKAQERKPHGTHAHARATSKYLSDFKQHEAVQMLQNLLDQSAPLEAMFTLIMHLKWPELDANPLPRWVPPRWPTAIREFYMQAQLEKWWRKEAVVWDKSAEESTRMFANVSFKGFLKPFVGDIEDRFTFIPNVSYPTDSEIGIRMGRELICIAPPRLAWGDSPPWPFDEDPMHIYRAALSQFGRLLMVTYLRGNAERVAEAAQNELPVSDQFKAMYPAWEEQFTNLFVSGAVVMYLEDHVSQAEANAFVLMEKKARGMDILPGVVSVLRRYEQELEAGRYKDLLDFLPVFPRQLRVAKRIVNL